MNLDLFGDLPTPSTEPESLGPGALLLPALATPYTTSLLSAIKWVTERAPFRNMTTPGGYRMSVAITNCGAAGWISDPSGYRYDAIDPDSGRCWPAMPTALADLAAEAAA